MPDISIKLWTPLCRWGNFRFVRLNIYVWIYMHIMQIYVKVWYPEFSCSACNMLAHNLLSDWKSWKTMSLSFHMGPFFPLLNWIQCWEYYRKIFGFLVGLDIILIFQLNKWTIYFLLKIFLWRGTLKSKLRVHKGIKQVC